jgi:hypothetical protein
MGMLILEATDSLGEQLASRAAEATGVAMGWDADLSCATFDSDELGDAELQKAIYDALAATDPDWASHLQATE